MIRPLCRARAYAVVACVLVAACSHAHQASSENSAAQHVNGGPSPAAAAVTVALAEEDDAVRPVYPLGAFAPDPAVLRLCGALQEAPQTRLAECRATTPGVLMTSECVRMLSAAMRAGAVTLASSDVDRCVDATNRALAGCEWARAGGPQPPAECDGIVHGTLAVGARCRSSLECLEGLRCHGVGPTNAGQCGAPRDEDGACGASVDSLAAYVRQNDYELRHPECRGWCNGRRCAAAISRGARCVQSAQCTAGSSCTGRTCAAGWRQPPPGPGPSL